ncbi:MAG: OsmC family protein [Planctomycetes bacterium]|nr:OsmC family protein [Planctomycetota bacterium]
MVSIQIDYSGGLRCSATHGPSGAKLATDAPKDNQGLGESFSPTDLLATALVTCMLTIMGIAARKHGWKLEGARGFVEKQMVADPQRRIGRLPIRIELPPGLPKEARPILEQAALTCPVHLSVNPAIERPVTFVYPD